MRYCGADHYSIEACECETADIYQDETLSSDERVLRLTQRLSDHYCEMIRRFPEGWFWLHRRWKTRPEGGEESVYS
jgi:lauroyl/myristoyl acyltransferase